MIDMMKTTLLAGVLATAASGSYAAVSFDVVEAAAFGMTEVIGNGDTTLEVGETFNLTAFVGAVDPLFASDVAVGNLMNFDFTYGADESPTFTTMIGTLTFTATSFFAPTSVGVDGIAQYILGNVSGSGAGLAPPVAASLIISNNSGSSANLSAVTLSVPPAGTSEIPLPAGGVLLLGALGALGLARRKAA